MSQITEKRSKNIIFIEHLKGLDGITKDGKVKRDPNTGVFAELRRSLAFAPGEYVRAFPHVERFVTNSSSWERQMYYLFAALYAAHDRTGRIQTETKDIGNVIGELYHDHKESPSIEKRFLALLDADEEQLPYRIRQMMALIKEKPINWEDLLSGLVHWRNDDKRVQRYWASSFYRHREDKQDKEN